MTWIITCYMFAASGSRFEQTFKCKEIWLHQSGHVIVCDRNNEVVGYFPVNSCFATKKD